MLHGWAGSVLPVDQQTAQDCFFDLVDFARRQWDEQYNNVKGPDHSLEEKATALDITDFPTCQDLQSWNGRRTRRLRRDFDPINRPDKGKGTGGYQRPIFQQAVECWNCGPLEPKLRLGMAG